MSRYEYEVGWDITLGPLITLKSILNASGRYLRLCKLRAKVYVIDLLKKMKGIFKFGSAGILIFCIASWSSQTLYLAIPTKISETHALKQCVQ